MPWILDDFESCAGQVVGSGQCVSLLQDFGVPHTSKWRAGISVRGSGCEAGTCIASFDPNGTYGNHVDGRSHAAVFIAEQADGLLVFDQWKGHAAARRVIQFRGGNGRRVNDGDAFAIIEDE